ncbi:MAG: hypothetical protein N3A69_01340, partial [Leptospiraceae bacterium]|nr:hypothetical protein [Leptospiraceae bacterium]
MGVLAQMTEMSLTPKLRFPEFANDPPWKLKKLGEVGEIIRGLTYGADDVSKEGLLVLRAGNIQD